jgi:hypothetical protein
MQQILPDDESGRVGDTPAFLLHLERSATCSLRRLNHFVTGRGDAEIKSEIQNPLIDNRKQAEMSWQVIKSEHAGTIIKPKHGPNWLCVQVEMVV